MYKKALSIMKKTTHGSEKNYTQRGEERGRILHSETPTVEECKVVKWGNEQFQIQIIA